MEIEKTFNRLPATINNAYPTGKSGRRYLSEEGRAWKDELAWSFKSRKPSKKDFIVEIFLEFGDNRKRDIDNGLKLILDALSGIIWEDDKQVREVHLYREYKKKHKTTISICEI